MSNFSYSVVIVINKSSRPNSSPLVIGVAASSSCETSPSSSSESSILNSESSSGFVKITLIISPYSALTNSLRPIFT